MDAPSFLDIGRKINIPKGKPRNTFNNVFKFFSSVFFDADSESKVSF